MTTNTELAAAKRFLEELCGGTPTAVLCAVSGGKDSMSLLHLLTTWGREQELTVTAAHFNHQLRGAESDRDEAFVRDWCAAHGVPFVCGSGDVRGHADESGKTLEEAARDMRYAFLAEQKEQTGSAFILTAHHADDNAETQLLNLLRGTGLRGLAGIPERRGDIARPFLRVTRAEIEAYVAAHDIKCIEDTTNAEDIAARNLLRHHVMPVLRELNPRAMENMARAAEQLQADEEALCRMASALQETACRDEGAESRINAAVCLRAERAVLTRMIHGVVSRMAGHRKDLTARHIDAVCGLLTASEGKCISLPYGLAARREKEDVVLFRKAEQEDAAAFSVGKTAAFGDWTVRVSEKGPGMELRVPADAALRVTVWDRNDRMTLPGGQGARSLKRLCSERGISPDQRDRLPVLRVDGKCAAVPGVGVDSEFLSGQNRTVFVDFQFQTEEKER